MCCYDAQVRISQILFVQKRINTLMQEMAETAEVTYVCGCMCELWSAYFSCCCCTQYVIYLVLVGNFIIISTRLYHGITISWNTTNGNGVWGEGTVTLTRIIISHCVQQRVGRSTGDKEDKPTGAQAHQRMVTTLQKQIAVKEKEKEEVYYALNMC